MHAQISQLMLKMYLVLDVFSSTKTKCPWQSKEGYAIEVIDDEKLNIQL